MLLTDFIEIYHPRIADQFEIINMTYEDLKGKTVIATRAGFSCGNDGGTEMIVGELTGKNENYVKLNPTENSKHLSEIGWLCDIKDMAFSFRLKK